MKQFNIRVYGIVIREDKVLLLRESYGGHTFVKFPGGGLEMEESIPDCLRREFQEEFGVEIENLHHFYTQDFFMRSMFNPEESVLTVYYTCTLCGEEVQCLDRDAEIIWVQLNENSPVDLPADKKVWTLLQNQFLTTAGGTAHSRDIF